MATHGQSSTALLRLPFAVWVLPWVAFAAALWLWAWPGQMQRACWLGEWPFEEGCAASHKGADLRNPSALYVQHLQRNVGDSRALAWLTHVLWQEADPRAAELLPHALQLAPRSPLVLAIDADARLRARDWPGAAKALIGLLERGQPQARSALLALMVDPETQPAVLAQLDNHARWLDPLLASLDGSVNAAALQPFVTAGSELGLLSPRTVLGLVDRLKRDRAWIEAYTLWVAWKGEVSPGLYNGSFAHPFLRRGFDWEWTAQPPAKQGFRINRASAAPRPGWMLEVTLTGRGALPVPLLSQMLVLPGPRYRMRGQYMTDRLATKEGLVWALRCADGGERWAQTEAVLDTRREWLSFELEFEPPPTCHAAVRLQLEATAAWETRAGITGTVFFSGLSVEDASLSGTAFRQGAPAS